MLRSTSLASIGAALGLLAACVCTDEHEDAEAGGDSPLADTDADADETPWLLAIDEDEGTIDALIRIGVEPGSEGEVVVVCADLELPSEFDPDTNFTSLAYHRGVLYASAARATWGDTLVRIDPCACTVSAVGSYGFTLVSGLASKGDSMLGLAGEDDLMITIDPATADAEQRATLSDDWGSHGLTPAGPNQDLFYGLDAAGDRLHRFDGEGAQLDSVATSEDFAAAGLEFHPGRGLLYACGLRDQGDALVTIDPESGLVRVVAESVFMTDCDNLAGPSGPIECAG
ncbi:hypothetical protein ACNOYE_22215 [Nannocystaceae bacterium ST9]